MAKPFICALLCAGLLMQSCKQDKSNSDPVNSSPEIVPAVSLEWEQLFNGRDLSNWIPKVKGYATGLNPMDTFRVEDGYLTVSYAGYDSFNNAFGHLFYEKPYTAYYLAVEYRFTGEQMPGVGDWAFRNSGVMLHGQSPKSMTVQQDFPISLEGQLLGGDGTHQRPTLNLCTPGTTVVIAEELRTEHCITSSAPTFHGDQWVRAGFLVLKDSIISHLIKGEPVMTYSKPRIDGMNVNEFDPDQIEIGTSINKGSISIQSESHPVQFRKIELIDLEAIYEDKPALQATIEAILNHERESAPVTPKA